MKIVNLKNTILKFNVGDVIRSTTNNYERKANWVYGYGSKDESYSENSDALQYESKKRFRILKLNSEYAILKSSRKFNCIYKLPLAIEANLYDWVLNKERLLSVRPWRKKTMKKYNKNK